MFKICNDYKLVICLLIIFMKSVIPCEVQQLDASKADNYLMQKCNRSEIKVKIYSIPSIELTEAMTFADNFLHSSLERDWLFEENETNNIKRLVLAHNHIESVQTDFLDNFRKLEYLRIEDHNLILLDIQQYQNLPNMKDLHFEVKQMSNVYINNLPGELETLFINNTIIIDDNSAPVERKYPKLYSLALRNCSLHRLTFDLAKPEKLVHLDLSFNELKEFKFLENGNFSQLKSINFRNSSISTNPRIQMNRFPQLEELSVDGIASNSRAAMLQYKSPWTDINKQIEDEMEKRRTETIYKRIAHGVLALIVAIILVIVRKCCIRRCKKSDPVPPDQTVFNFQSQLYQQV